MGKSWPGMKDAFKSWDKPGKSGEKPGKSGQAPGNGGAVPPGLGGVPPGQEGKDHTSNEVKQVLNDGSVPQQATPPPAQQLPPSTQPGTTDTTRAKGPAGTDPKISQFAPAGAAAGYDGSEACGPTVGAMVARNIGYGGPNVSDAALVQELGQVAGTNGQGTTGNGMIAMFEHMGMDTNATAGANLDWMRQELAAGHHVTALGDYYEVPGRVDTAKTSGHYLDVTGMTPDGTFLVNDPANTALNSMTAAEMSNFIGSAPNGGFVISAWKPTGAPVTG